MVLENGYPTDCRSVIGIGHGQIGTGMDRTRAAALDVDDNLSALCTQTDKHTLLIKSTLYVA